MLRVVIVDDEAPARKRLSKLLQPMVDAGRIDIIAEAEDGVEGLDILNSQRVDLVFLDIKMPELSGFDTLERLAPERRPLVVFTTAYDTYALRAFEANAIDYLLKPVSQERLEEAVSRAERATRTPEWRKIDEARFNKLFDWLDAQAEKASSESAKKPVEYLRQISVPFRDRILIIPTNRLVSAEIHEGITRLYVLEDENGTSKGRIRQHIIAHTLDQLESNLDPDQFIRVHRSAIVQIQHIQEMIAWFSGRYKLILSGSHEVIASRERSKILKDRLML